MYNQLNKYFNKIRDLLINKLLELIFTTNVGIIVLFRILNWQVVNKVLKCVEISFIYLTFLIGILLISKFISFIMEQILIEKEYIALKDSRNWDLMFDEKTLLNEFFRRNLQFFERNMVNSSLIYEYYENVQDNCDPDLPVMMLLEEAYSKLSHLDGQNQIINNLQNHKFITQLPSRNQIYKINDFIWKYEQKEKQKEEQKRIKEKKEFNKIIKQRKSKILFIEDENSHKIINFCGIKIKLKTNNSQDNIEL